MYKRHTGQVSMLESPEMFGSLPLDPNNDWIKLSKLVPWLRVLPVCGVAASPALRCPSRCSCRSKYSRMPKKEERTAV